MTGCADGNTDHPTAGGGVTDEAAEQAPSPSAVHPDFSLTADDLDMLTDGMPPEIRARIADRPTVFLERAKDLLALPEMILARADKQTRLPADFEPADLVDLARYGDRWILNREGLSLRAPVIPDLAAMIEAARLDGILLDISSSYRSYDYQDRLFAYWVDQLGQEEAERVSARPGTSQHQLGTTMDFGSVSEEFADVPAGRWLAAHAWRFGFSLSYPDGMESITGYAYEPWHFRWISRAGTAMEREFFGGVQQYFIEFWESAGPTLAGACTACS